MWNRVGGKVLIGALALSLVLEMVGAPAWMIAAVRLAVLAIMILAIIGLLLMGWHLLRDAWQKLRG